MDILDAIKARRSVRAYSSQPIEGAALTKLRAAIDEANAESGLDMQLVLGKPDALARCRAQYGTFSGMANFIALVGPDDAELDEKCGYYGEHVVLAAKCAGLDTCWIAFSWRNDVQLLHVRPGQRLVCAIAVGYAAQPGVDRRRNSVEALCTVDGFHPSITKDLPRWFLAGMEAARLAPTAMHQQAFCVDYRTDEPDRARIRALGGPMANVDLGIVRYHFEAGADSTTQPWEWA